MPRNKKPKRITKEQFDRWSPEKQQRALNDRRTRIRIEDRALPKEWLDRRNRARRNRTPITPGSGTTYGDLAKQRAYLEPLTFGEGDRQLADRTANLSAARQRDADWFTKYRADVAAAQQRAIGAQSQAAEGNRALIDSANQVSMAGRDAVVRQLQERAAQLGQAPQGGEYQALADQAAAARATSLANTAQRQIADANTNVGLATDAVGTAALKDLEARGFRDRQQGALDQDKRDYGSKKDAWRAKFIDDAIAEARKQVLEDRAFGLNAADKAADNKLARQRLALDKKKARQDAAMDRRREARLQAQADRKAAGGGSRGGKSGKGGRQADPNKGIQRAVKSINSIGPKLTGKTGLITLSQQGAAKGRAVKGGADSVIRVIMDRAGVDREVAKRALYAYIAYRGSIPSTLSYGSAPKSWGQALKRGGFRK